jgi:hypothetical protein
MNQAQPLLNQHLRRAAQAGALLGAGAGGMAIANDISQAQMFGNYEQVPGEAEAIALMRVASLREGIKGLAASGRISIEEAESALAQLGGDMAQSAPAAGEGQLNIG